MKLTTKVKFDRKRSVFIAEGEALPGMPAPKVEMPGEILNAMLAVAGTAIEAEMADVSGFNRPENVTVRAVDGGLTFEFTVRGKLTVFHVPAAEGKRRQDLEDAVEAMRGILAGLVLRYN